MIPGVHIPTIIRPLAGFSIVAEALPEEPDFIGYGDATFLSAQVQIAGPWGSASGLLQSDGGTVAALFSSGSDSGLWVRSGGQGLSLITFDGGMPRPLYLDTGFPGYDVYSFGEYNFVASTRYTVVLS